jgi:iron-sulfur cluster assembly protein
MIISDAAAAKIQELASSKGEGFGLRIAVRGGGCAGLTLKMEIGQQRPDDKVFKKNGAQVFIDRKSFLFLNGSLIDFKDTLQSAGFVVSNPRSSRTCGCGQSFAI